MDWILRRGLDSNLGSDSRVCFKSSSGCTTLGLQGFENTKFFPTIASTLGTGSIGGMLALGAQTATAQSVTATTPFAFSAGSQSYPAGTYQFTLVSQWSLSIRNVNGGGERFFAVHPEETGPLASHGKLSFGISEGHRTLQAVYVPGTDIAAELLQHDPSSRRAKSDASLVSASIPSKKATAGNQNAMGR